ncbi:hypothetical protein A2707_03090 [Candidatus Saccharibacteria bacterium RIFCSPHIGHO2_01_FULL_45_15]|nr:MAG: hypothetical protein A2707_03090 [Candidatus Saccharibacteria bacterium RIFCSPHIGHO2_01_FULL_45_15]OGL28475.1 MAG: hypothetical protein A3C39_02970 [Candidatus Saccharibacteria bacterium RIFCSPHIGHO2_02_FULL_46_12]OGL32512.1 MAG: hypothetical protein A3E76_00480 [Candidatus Saccharibacteria bacterium RIFCSPHIGHO2_12_FULL_44_22]
MKRLIDSVLNTVTMYHVVVAGLVTMSVVALVLMSTGTLGYSPLTFIISIILSVGTALASNKLFGWLFGVRVHSESATITGLIIALVFTPPATFVIALKLILVVMIAMASKYVITIRNKHVFNAAAFGIVTGSVSGLAYATWWIATPAMIPITLLVAVAILYKTKRLQMGSLFVAVSVGLLGIQAAFDGSISIDTFVSAITSWPLLFVAGVMLSEPLTLPPRRKQQLAVAALVGALSVSAIHIGPVLMTPALALIAGNVLAFYWSTRGSIKLRFAGKKQMGKSYYDLQFDVSRLPFVPGQYVELTLPHAHADVRGQRRVFTIVGKPGDDQISIGIRLPETTSSFKKALIGLKPGDVVYGVRIAGDFVLPDDPDTPIVCIAGGIGITPFMSFLMSVDRPITIIYAVRSIDDVAYLQQLRHYNATVTIVSSDGDGTLADDSWKHRTGELSRAVLADSIPVADQPHVYISGPPAMVSSTKKQVKSLGIRTVRTDHFTGY